MSSSARINPTDGKLTTLGRVISQAPGRSAFIEQLYRGGFLFSLLVVDALMLFLAFRVAYWVRFELKITTAPEVVPLMGFYFQLTLVIAVGGILLFALSGLYNWNNLLGGTIEYARAFNVCTITFLFVVSATFLFPSFVISRVWLAAGWIFSVVLVLGGRFVLRRIVYGLRAKGYFLVRAAVLGQNPTSLTLVDELREPKTGYQVLGLIALGDQTDLPASTNGGRAPKVLGALDDLEDIVLGQGIRELIVPASSLEREELFELYARVHGIEELELRLATELFELLTTKVQVRTAGVVPLIGLSKARLETTETVLKTVVEYLLTILGLTFLLPFLVFIGVLIKLDSPGPAIYRRRVIGVGGKEFDALKFRTMRADSDSILEKNPQLAAELIAKGKLANDPRITRLGRWLRKYSLDELPQLLNVLKGQMSLVGPRMISPPEAEKYGLNRFNLLTVKPGMTGLWQVSGRSNLSYEERVRLDMYYIRNYTIWLDFHILFIKTISAVLQGRGAY